MAGTGSRTLKLSILADVDQLKKSLVDANKDVETSTSKIGDFASKAGLAFAAAGVAAAAYAGKLLVDGVKSAIEDEAAQAKLATTLKNVTGATDTQIASVESYILQTSLATGVTDEQLRPSLERLTRATKDVDEATKLQNLALDIAAGSGKSLEAVSNALGKAYEGNTGALGKLGIGIDAASLKTMSMDQITKALADTFGGQANDKAETFAGKMDRLKVAFNEGKETVGSFVLDALTPLLTSLTNDIIPKIQDFASNLGEKLKPAFEDISTFMTETFMPAMAALWSFVNDYLIPVFSAYLQPVLDGIKTVFEGIASTVNDNKDKFAELLKDIKPFANFVKDTLAPAIGTVLKAALTVVGKLVDGLITGFGVLAGIIHSVVSAIKAIINLVADNPIVKGISGVINSVFGGGKAAGGAVSSSKSYIVGERGPEVFMPNQSGTIIPNNRLGSGGGSTVINLTVNGAIDGEGTARSIINLLNNSYFRGTGGATALVTS